VTEDQKLSLLSCAHIVDSISVHAWLVYACRIRRTHLCGKYILTCTLCIIVCPVLKLPSTVRWYDYAVPIKGWRFLSSTWEFPDAPLWARRF